MYCIHVQCQFRAIFLPDIKTHQRKMHADENIKIIHARLDRKDEVAIAETEYDGNDLLED